jgi:hypothetical protein
MNDRPLLDRLNLSSHRALMIWTITYALNHRDQISPETIVRMSKGNQSERKASEILSRFGLDLPRS